MPEYTQEQVDRWLANLAAGMKRHGQTVFLIEQLQPGWLPRRWQRWVYLLVSRILESSLFLYLFNALFLIGYGGGSLTLADKLLWTPLILARYGPPLGLVLGLVSAVSLGAAGSRSGRALIRFLLSFCASLLTFVLVGRTLHFSYGVPLLSAVFALFFHLRSSDRPLQEDIQTVQALVWTWRRALLGGGRNAAILALVLGPLSGFASTAQTADPWFVLSGVAVATLAQLALLWSLFGFFFGLQPGVVELAAVPRRGLRLSFRNALVAGTAGLAWISLSYWLVLLPFGALEPLVKAGPMALSTGLVAALIALLRYGQLDILRHYVLRLLLAATGVLPWRLPHFLDYAANEIHIVQPAGGGTMFLHRVLFEYFAPDPEPELRW